MIVTIDRHNRPAHTAALDAAYRLRHRIFVEEAGWRDLARPDGLERDEFDELDGRVEMLLYDRDELIGYQRLLPTTGPYLLTKLFPRLCDGPPPASEGTFEWTRFAVERGHRGDGASLGLAGALLVLAFVEWGLANGVDSVVVELAPIQMLKFAQCHFTAHPLGLVQKIGDQDTVAVLARFDIRTRDRLVTMLPPERRNGGAPGHAHDR